MSEMKEGNNTINSVLFRIKSGMLKTDEEIVHAYEIITNKMSTEKAEIRGANGLIFISLIKRVQDIKNKTPKLPSIKTEPEEYNEVEHSSIVPHTSTFRMNLDTQIAKRIKIEENSEETILKGSSGFTDKPWTPIPDGLIELLNLIDDGLIEELDIPFTA